MAKRIAVITVQRSTWEVIENLSQRFRNELEKRELLETVLSVEKLGDKTLIAVEKSKLKKSNPLYKLLDPLEPNWRESLTSGIGYLEEAKTHHR
jgi:hypothetical protein